LTLSEGHASKLQYRESRRQRFPVFVDPGPVKSFAERKTVLRQSAYRNSERLKIANGSFDMKSDAVFYQRPPAGHQLSEPVDRTSPTDFDPYLTVQEAACLLQMSMSFLNKARVYGGGPIFVRFGRKIRYRKSALENWAAARTFTATCEY
jgi:hypothetical protein